MGTYMTDANEIDLFSGADLSTDQTSNFTGYEIDWPQDIEWVLTLGTVTGTNSVDIQVSELSDFSGTLTRTVATIPFGSGDSSTTLLGVIYVDGKYIRARTTIGTGGDAAGSTLKLRQKQWLRTKKSSTKALA